MTNYRKVIIDELVPFAEADKKLILLIGDMGFGAIDQFQAKFPGRIFNLGIMEQGMLGAAAGLALGGMRPVVYTMVNFLAFRAIEQVRNDIVVQHLPVKMIGTGANDYFRFLGKSHCCGNQDSEIMKMIGVKVFDPYLDKRDFKTVMNDWMTCDETAYIRV